ncbi:uncharacterized protein LY79DRAFT_584837 [Colletotrichum navitas]|uniref:Uncharacterized protein n=1 Tax=Colletotrichum navitas TaxID=681940 RepID=A0AAD8PKJ2_9PEZI|nr:uncharacterized protein LY79DRAFT_584837 [Colletotrichum navitas]KAK1566363.1 hypothetical protein LY79DRAFT_584837 [Colletotrichum navitas]
MARRWSSMAVSAGIRLGRRCGEQLCGASILESKWISVYGPTAILLLVKTVVLCHPVHHNSCQEDKPLKPETTAARSHRQADTNWRHPPALVRIAMSYYGTALIIGNLRASGLITHVGSIVYHESRKVEGTGIFEAAHSAGEKSHLLALRVALRFFRQLYNY